MDDFFLTALLKFIGVLLLIIASFFIAFRLSRLQSRSWLIVYLVTFTILLLIVILKRFPWLQFEQPFSLFFQGRSEILITGVVSILLLITPLPRLPFKNQKRMVILLSILCVCCSTLLPFFLPLVDYKYLRSLTTTMDSDGVCLQSNGYTCGPAAAVTVLRQLGINAREGELAESLNTNFASGTAFKALHQVINEKYCKNGIQCRYRHFKSITDMKGFEPLIVLFKYTFMVDHYVAVLHLTDKGVIIGDPLKGKLTLSYKDFEYQWRHCGLIITKKNVSLK